MKILSLSGFIPECFCDTVRFAGYAGDRNISHYCGYASDFISQVLYDDSIDGAVFPKSCDSTRIMKSYFENSGKFIYQLPVPARSDAIAVDYFASVLQDFERRLCDQYHLDEINVGSRIEAVNRRNEDIKNLYENIENKSFYSLLCHVHDTLSKPLSEQKIIDGDIASREKTSKRVYVIGSFLANENIVKIMEDSGLTIVGDDLPEIGRLAFYEPVSTRGDLYRNVAKSILAMRKSPTEDQFQDVCDRDVNEIRNREAKGVIFVTQKYCEAYDYFFYRMKNRLDKIGIPSIQIPLSDSQDEGRSRLQIEAFADMM